MAGVYRRPAPIKRRRPWVGTAPSGPTIVETVAVIYGHPGGVSGPPGTIEL